MDWKAVEDLKTGDKMVVKLGEHPDNGEIREYTISDRTQQQEEAVKIIMMPFLTKVNTPTPADVE